VEAMCDGCGETGMPLLPGEVDEARSLWGWVRVGATLGVETAVCATTTLVWCVKCVEYVSGYRS
jgi:hypothetical protein